MLARCARPALRSQFVSTRLKRACYHTESFPTEIPGVTKMKFFRMKRLCFDIDIYNYHGRNNDSPIVIFLPALPVEQIQFRLQDDQQLNHVPLNISDSLGKAFRVARINYRWASRDWPKPMHEVVLACDAIVKNFCTAKTKIGVYGRHLGGTLATSLALTESKPSKSPGSISALATAGAVCDWSQLASEEVTPENFPYICQIEDDRSRAVAIESLKKQKNLIRHLFPNPAACFDPFASPILFFRNAGREVPEDFRDLNPEISVIFEHSSAKLQSNQLGRKSYIRFPPKNSGLVIPKSRITSNVLGAPDEQQGRELVKAMRRSIVMYEMKERGDIDFDVKEEADNRVQYVLDADPVGMTSGFYKENLAKEGRIVAWLEEALND